MALQMMEPPLTCSCHGVLHGKLTIYVHKDNAMLHTWHYTLNLK